MAVPFFFITSGFFYGRKLIGSNKDETFLPGYLKRLGVPFVFWECVNIVIEILKQLFIKQIPIGQVACNVIQSILFYPYGALWYVQALLIALVIVTLAYNRGFLRQCIIISIGLYIVGLLGNSYYFLIDGTRYQCIVDNYLAIFVSTRNAIFVALYFVSIGVWIASRVENSAISGKNNWSVIVLYSIFVFEAFLLRNCRSADDKSMFLTFLILIPVLFTTIKNCNCKIKNAKKLRSYSTGIYFMHKAVIHIWLVCFAFLDVKVKPTIEFLIVFASCLFACYVLRRVNNKYINMLIS